MTDGVETASAVQAGCKTWDAEGGEMEDMKRNDGDTRQ